MAFPSKIDVEKALELKTEHNLSYAEIAAIQGCTKQAVHQRIQALLPDPKLLNDIKEHLPSLLIQTAFDQIEQYHKLDSDDKRDMVKRRGMVDPAIAIDKYRLLTDQSTSNVVSIVGDIEQIRSMRAARTPQEADENED